MVKPLNTDFKKQDSMDTNTKASQGEQDLEWDEGIEPPEEEEVGENERQIHALKLYAINCG